MMLVRRRGTHHVEMHDDLDLCAFILPDEPFMELDVNPDITFYGNHRIAVVSTHELSYLPTYAKYLMDITFFEDTDRQFSI